MMKGFARSIYFDVCNLVYIYFFDSNDLCSNVHTYVHYYNPWFICNALWNRLHCLMKSAVVYLRFPILSSFLSFAVSAVAMATWCLSFFERWGPCAYCTPRTWKACPHPPPHRQCPHQITRPPSLPVRHSYLPRHLRTPRINLPQGLFAERAALVPFWTPPLHLLFQEQPGPIPCFALATAGVVPAISISRNPPVPALCSSRRRQRGLRPGRNQLGIRLRS